MQKDLIDKISELMTRYADNEQVYDKMIEDCLDKYPELTAFMLLTSHNLEKSLTNQMEKNHDCSHANIILLAKAIGKIMGVESPKTTDMH